MFKKKPKPPPRNVETFELKPEAVQPMTIIAYEPFSAQRLAVKPGETYIVKVPPGQDWVDLFLHADPLKGCFNLLALIKGMRVRGARCFTLCAAYNENDEDGVFRVQVDKPILIPAGKTSLSFFPNDCEGYYDNNEGSINITVERIS